ncbi:MAG: hypothetical protein HQK94_06475 [Nitrospirae bacterium]|nr:hypothetical protein [Nitrospirota bacterium]MBF0533596.1 hypothetical protein [Nitrospirota bacterium]
MLDITNSRLPLHNILLKSSRLSLLLDIPENVKLFKQWAEYAELNQFIVETYKTSIEAAKDRDISIASSNPYQIVSPGFGNSAERKRLKEEAQQVTQYLAKYRTDTYNFALDIYTKWQFGNIAQSIFEKKRNNVEPILREIFSDIKQRLNSIEQNIASENPEDWKNSVASCRTLLMDIADILNPPQGADDRNRFINRLKDFVAPRVESETKKKFLKNYYDELKKRIEYTMEMTQGGAHKQRPKQQEAEDVVLYTYLIIADLIAIYNENKVNTSANME